MSRIALSRTERSAHPRQVLPRERAYAVGFASLFFALLSLPLWGTFAMPEALAYVIALCYCYWTAQALYSVWCAVRALRLMNEWMGADWLARYLQKGRTVRQVVVVPNFCERADLLSQTLERLAAAHYPREHLCVVLAMEEREQGAQAKAEALRAKYEARFGHFWITAHPLLPGETACKGANLSYCLRQVSKRAQAFGWDPAEVMVTTVDADARLHPQHLAALAVRFLDAREPTRVFFQGMLMLLNNTWEISAPSRVLAAFWTFSFVAASAHYQRLTTAVYSMSLRLLQDAGYWDPRVIAEDGHIYFRAFFALQGRPNVEPIYLPVGLDAVKAPTLWQSVAALFRQMQRWAWTVANLPFLADAWAQRSDVPLARKVVKVLPYVESLLFMPVAWLIITFGILLPPVLNSQIVMSVFGVPLSVAGPLILSPTLAGVVMALAVNAYLRRRFAPRSEAVSWRRRIAETAEWSLMPLTIFYFGIPYIQAYWHLLTGDELRFERTAK